jgi:hypothetical protein
MDEGVKDPVQGLTRGLADVIIRIFLDLCNVHQRGPGAGVEFADRQNGDLANDRIIILEALDQARQSQLARST